MTRAKEVKLSTIRDTAYSASNNVLDAVSTSTGTIANTLRATEILSETLIDQAEAYADTLRAEIAANKKLAMAKSLRKIQRQEMLAAKENAKAAAEAIQWAEELAKAEAAKK